MRLHNMISAVGLTLVTAGCAAAGQSTATTQVAGVGCTSLGDVDQQVAALYAPDNLQRVEPVYRTERLARATQHQYVSGARLHVPAQQGMTQGYLDRVLSCHAASQATVHPNDPLQVANVSKVDVEARGQRFVIAIEGADRKAGREIWQRAQALRTPSQRVEVKQLSEAPTPGAQL